MKRTLFTTLICLIGHFAAVAQTCNLAYVTLNSQAAVDGFNTTYPGCTQVTGPLTISGPDITNLNGLNAVISIKGDISIDSNPLLTSLSGLSNLKNVIQGSLQVYRNPGLTSLNGLGSLVSITSASNKINGGRLSIGDNSGLSDLTGLTSLAIVENSLGIADNSSMVNLLGLNALTSVGRVDVVNNPILTSLLAPGVLETCKEMIYLLNNPLLNSITGFENLDEVRHLTIDSNPMLTNLNGFQSFTRISGDLRINNNATLVDLQGLGNVRTIGGVFFLTNGATSTIGLSALEVIFGQLYINQNSITDLAGLSKVYHVGSRLYIGSNPQLVNLNGLSSLQSISGELILTSNAVLSDISALQGLIMSNGFTKLTITDSPMLSDCSLGNICIYLDRPGSGATINNNAGTCMTREDIVNSSTCISILPVDLISFLGEKSAEGNKLTWRTASEITNTGFEIERSSNARTFSKIGFVAGNGNSNQERQYTFTDSSPFPVSYYRLKQIDFDGKSTHSKIIFLKGDDQAARVYPNPARGQLHIESVNRNQSYSIKNIQGFSVMESAVLPTKPLDTSSLQNGLYLITVGKEVFKVAVQN
jgi:hypothetical protein